MTTTKAWKIGILYYTEESYIIWHLCENSLAKIVWYFLKLSITLTKENTFHSLFVASLPMPVCFHFDNSLPHLIIHLISNFQKKNFVSWKLSFWCTFLYCTAYYYVMIHCILTHWGRVMHICVGKLTIIGSDNGLSPGRRQAIIWTNAGILFIRTLGTNFSEILSEIHTFSFKKMHLKMSSGKWRPFCLGLNVLRRLICD